MGVRLSFLGDLFLSGDLAGLPPAARSRFFDALAPALDGSHAVFANFEGVVLNEVPGDLPPDKIRMPVHADWLSGLRSAGVDVLSLSNNHVFDYGVPAFRESREQLQAAGFQVFGAGMDAAEAARPLVRPAGGLRVGFVGFTCDSTHPARVPGGGGVVSLQIPDLLDRVTAARRLCDFLVVSVHWGDEHVAWPSPDQVRTARRLVEAGADVVAGHHAHVLQGTERYRHGVIAYGLGGITIAGLSQQVVWQGVEQVYRFEPERRHRRSAVLSVEVESGRVGGAVLQPVAIADDGRPEPLACPPKRVREGGLRLWHLPGYSLFYRGVVFLQFWLAPRLRAAFSRHLVHKLVRRLRHAFGAAEP